MYNSTKTFIKYVICISLLIAALVQPAGYMSYCINNNRIALADHHDGHCDMGMESGYTTGRNGFDCLSHSPSHYHCALPMLCESMQSTRLAVFSGDDDNFLSFADSQSTSDDIFTPASIHALKDTAQPVTIVLPLQHTATILLI